MVLFLGIRLLTARPQKHDQKRIYCTMVAVPCSWRRSDRNKLLLACVRSALRRDYQLRGGRMLHFFEESNNNRSFRFSLERFSWIAVGARVKSIYDHHNSSKSVVLDRSLRIAYISFIGTKLGIIYDVWQRLFRMLDNVNFLNFWNGLNSFFLSSWT